MEALVREQRTRMTRRAVSFAGEDPVSRQGVGAERVRIAGREPVGRTVAGAQRTNIAGQRAGQVVRRDVAFEGRAERLDV